jgi:putative lipoic acid-binding regulatory protein
MRCCRRALKGNFQFEVDALIEHIDFYAHLLDKAGELGYTIEDVRISATALDERRLQTLQANVLDELSSKHPSKKVELDQGRRSGRGYYTDVCFTIHARNQEGMELLLVDGGLTTWTQQLLSNRKERLMTSGLGSERLCACFHKRACLRADK